MGWNGEGRTRRRNEGGRKRGEEGERGKMSIELPSDKGGDDGRGGY